MSKIDSIEWETKARDLLQRHQQDKDTEALETLDSMPLVARHAELAEARKVPREPSAAMLRAGAGKSHIDAWYAMYDAALATAPKEGE